MCPNYYNNKESNSSKKIKLINFKLKSVLLEKIF